MEWGVLPRASSDYRYLEFACIEAALNQCQRLFRGL
jgi:hypothetical protein